MLAVSTGSGFIGGIIAGFLAGYVAKLISSKLKLPQSMEALKPILIIPLISSPVVGLAMIYLIGKPVAGILAGLTHWLQTMGTANAVLLECNPRRHDVYRHGWSGEQSGVRLWCWPAEYPDLRANGSHHGGRYGTSSGARPGDDYCPS